MPDRKYPHSGFRALLLTCSLLLPATAGAQGCITEQEPNDTPAEATPVEGAACLTGVLSGSDQDAFVWTVSEEDSESLWRFELESVPGQLASVEVFTVDFADNGVDVTRADSHLKVSTNNGRMVSSVPRLFAAGTYILGLSLSDGQGPYSLALLPDDPLRPFRSGEPDPELVFEVEDSFDQAGQMGPQQAFSWTVNEEMAAQLWQFELSAAVGESLTLAIHNPDGSALTEVESGDTGTASVGSLGVEAGTYRLLVTSASGRTAPFWLKNAPQGVAADGQEIEPNDSHADANFFDSAEELRGTLTSGGDTDHFRFTVDAEQSAHLLELQTGTDEHLEVCLFDQHNDALQCRAAPGARLPALHLAAGDYGLRLSSLNNEADLPYTLTLRDAGEPEAGTVTEPNDTLAMAFPLPESMTVRGELWGQESDFLRLEITGEPQLWRVQAIGPGVQELRYYTAAGHNQYSETGADRVRLDNLHLLPGTHYFRVSGQDSEYALRLLPLGKPDGEPLPAPADSASESAEVLPEEELATMPAEPRPNGIMEREPNSNLSSADLLVFNEPRVGLLTSSQDRDFYRFYLPAGQHVNLQVIPPADAEYEAKLHWGSVSVMGAVNSPGEVISGQEWLPAGDYHLELSARTPSNEYYQVSLERLNPFTAAPGREAQYPQWFGRSADEADGAETTGPAELDVELELLPDSVDTVAAYWPYSQELELNLTVANPAGESRDLQLDWHSSDGGWRPDLPATLTVPGEGQEQLNVPVIIAPDAVDEPAVLTVRARTADGRQQTVAVTLSADSMVEPVGSHLSWPVPDALLGGFDAAWLDMGAEIILTSDEERVVADRLDLHSLFDGMTPLGHNYFEYRMWDRVPREYGMEEFPPTVRLAGDAPVQVAGFLLNSTATADISRSLRDFAVHLSMDGQDFVEAYRGTLSPGQVEQAFVLPEPVEARYARLELLSNYVPDAGPQDTDIRIGSFKVVTTSDSALAISGPGGVNIADPGLGGHVVWSDPTGAAHVQWLLASGDDHVRQRLDFEQEDATWVVGFHHNRAAQITEIQWTEYLDTGTLFENVEVSVSVDSPAGPWTSLGTWDLDRSHGGLDVEPFVLSEPVWARYVHFRAAGLTPRETYDYPDRISIIERSTDKEYRSIVGEWGHYNGQAIYEYLTDQVAMTARTVAGNSTREAAEPIVSGEYLQGTVELGVNEAWYRITVPADHNHLSVTLKGEPNRDFDHELTDEDGEPVPVQEHGSPSEVIISASVEPGNYWLRVFEPPRSVVIAWDTSGSVQQSLPVIYQALARFAENVSPGVEEVNLMPFDSPFLLRNWSGDPQRVQQAINDDPRNTSSSSGELALLRASEALAERPGKKAVILLTDASIPRDHALWASLVEVRPQVFASAITSTGALSSNVRLEQDLMQDYASVNGGHYEYVRTQGDFDVTFRRAAAWLRRPSQYTVSVETGQRWENASAWAVTELERALELDLIPEALAGADLTGPVTRAEFAAVAVRVFEILTGTEAVPVDENPFSDTDDPDVLKAFNTELAVGISESEFAPDALLNREQAATILTRVFKKVNLPDWTWAADADFELEFAEPEPFADDERISAWARESVYFMAANGIITGTGDGQFTPRAVTPEERALGYANATREQALLLAVRLVDSDQVP